MLSDKNSPTASWYLLDTLIAILGAVIVGIIIHYTSRVLGLDDTTPGVIIGTALSAVVLDTIHWER